MTHIISTLFPVFVVIGLGYFLARREFISRKFTDELNRFVYWISLPALMLNTLANAESLPPGTIRIWLIYITASSIVLGLSFFVARFLGLQRYQFGTFMQATFRGNIAFIGIPVLVYALRDQDDSVAAPIIAQGIFVFAPTMVFYNALSVIVLVASQDSNLRDNLPKALRNIATNPLILAAGTGLILFALPFDLPIPATNTLEFVGRMAGPAALVCVGGGMGIATIIERL